MTDVQNRAGSKLRDKTPTTKDKSQRPKKKKVYIACYHCQKAHLTCDENRPCQRCIRRNLADTCRDGRRKRAKYLDEDDLVTTLPPEPTSHSQHGQQQQQQQQLPLPPDARLAGPSQRPEFQAEVAMSHGPQNGSHHMNFLPLMPNAPEPQPAAKNVPLIDKNFSQEQQPLSQPLPPSHHSPSPLAPLQGDDGLHHKAPPDNTSMDYLSNIPAQQQPPSAPQPMLGQVTSPFDHANGNNYDFGSKMMNMEYSILSNILGSNGEEQQNMASDILGSSLQTPTPTPPDYSMGPPAFPQMSMIDPSWTRFQTSNPNPFGSGSTPSVPSDSPVNTSSPNDNMGARHSTPNQITSPQHMSLQYQAAMNTMKDADDINNNHSHSHINPPFSQESVPFVPLHAPGQSKYAEPIYLKPKPSSMSRSQAVAQSMKKSAKRTARDIYASVTKPFSYTPGFHAVIEYLKARFDREHLIAITRSMAAYRPSFIACTKTLVEEDLVFMEQCFQRTLLEYEKFISYSGTPTIVWRRTGQIAYVGKEFCILTGWSMGDLVGAGIRRFVVEIMDDASVVEYFELSSKLAFGDSRDTANTICTLLGPHTKPAGENGSFYRQQHQSPLSVEASNAAISEGNNNNEDLVSNDRISNGRSYQNFGTDPEARNTVPLPPPNQLRKIRAACTWTVKRDVFDIPMMVIGNFLPILD